MICIIAMVVFAVLAIFSAKYRPLAKEAFDCTFRKLTFRKCKTNLDQRIKSKLTGSVMAKSPVLAKLIYKHFEILSMIMVIIFFASIIYSGISAYNLIVYNNCNGADGGTCVFNPTGTVVQCTDCPEGGDCSVTSCTGTDCNCTGAACANK